MLKELWRLYNSKIRQLLFSPLQDSHDIHVPDFPSKVSLCICVYILNILEVSTAVIVNTRTGAEGLGLNSDFLSSYLDDLIQCLSFLIGNVGIIIYC